MNLKTLRKNAGLTQQEVAEKCGVTLRSYQNYEGEIREMNYSTLIRLAKIFNCSIDYLLGHETQGILHLDSFTPAQRKLIELIKELNPDQTLQTIGFCSGLLKASTELPRPW